jgi:Helicase conserved C-terminal domain
MTDFIQSLQSRDLSYLRIVAGFWDISIENLDAHRALQRLSDAIEEPALVQEVVDSLPSEARAALDDLINHGGRLPWPVFTRNYGAVREMGPGRRDRERPYRNTNAPAEMLWYRALVGRAFFDTPNGPQEFAYIPENLLGRLPESVRQAVPPLGRAASPVERGKLSPAGDAILDHCCTYLAALRLDLPEAELISQGIGTSFEEAPLTPQTLRALLGAAQLLDERGIPAPEPVRSFLEAPRANALVTLARAWLHSPFINDLRQLPGKMFEGDWQNDALRARQAILDFASTIPRGTWWSLSAFIADVRERHADFQRPAGDYDSWYIRDELSGEFLRGFSHWEAVDGALIRYVICGPMYWLGLVDLAAPFPKEDVSDSTLPVTAFRLTEWFDTILGGGFPEGLPVEDQPVLVASDARLRVPSLAPRAVRYQLARFGMWEAQKNGVYVYRITPASLARARQQGLQMGHLIGLLRRYAQAVPPNLAKALERWNEYGSEARIQEAVVLRLASPELLQTLRASRAARFLGEPLGPTAIIVKPGAWKKVTEVLVELGYLSEGEVEGD